MSKLCACVSFRGAQFAIDVLVRLAPSFQPEEIIDHARHQEPAAEIKEERWDLVQASGRDDHGVLCRDRRGIGTVERMVSTAHTGLLSRLSEEKRTHLNAE